MKKRYIELLQFLQQSKGDYVSGSELANIFNVTTRTIRNDIKEMNDNYLKDVSIIGNTHKGYKLLGNITEIQQSQDDFGERAFQIIKILLLKESFVTYDYLAQNLYFSTQTIRKDVQRIFQTIQSENRNIKLEAIIFQGIRLHGKEIDKRLLLGSLVSPSILSRMSVFESLQYYFKDWIHSKDISRIISIVEKELMKYHLLLDAKELFTICINIIITKQRISNDHALSETDMILEHQEFEESTVAKNLLEQLNLVFNVNVNEYEQQYLSYLLISLQVFPKNYETNEINLTDKDKVQEIILRIIRSIAIQYGISLEKHDRWVARLLMHITKSLNPLKYYFPIENPFILQIKSEYIAAYNIAVVLAKELQGNLKINIPENEIGYLALHMMNIIDNSQDTRHKIVIVYGKNQLVGNLLERKMNVYFPHIKIEGLYASNEVHLISQEIDTLITTMHMEESYPVQGKNIIRVSEMITDDDVKSISLQLNRKLFEHYLSPADFFLLDELDQKSLLKSLTEQGNIEYLYESILDRENMSSTNIGNLVAMPHPFDAGENGKLRVLVAINKRKITWGDQFAQIVFLFIPPINQKVNNSSFFSEIYSVLKYSNLTSKLIEVTSHKEFIEVWNSNN